MKIAMTGSGGLIGSALAPALAAAGHEVVRLRRVDGVPDPGEAAWNPATGAFDPTAVSTTDVVIHLAGENLASGRWTKERRKRILASRANATARLCTTLAQAQPRPRVLLSASAIGYYGDRGDTILDETHSRGSGFLADVCRAWEEATGPATAAGIRVVNLRFGMVLSAHGGALVRMLTPFRLGLGGPMGNGQQWVSWIAIDDLVRVVAHVIGDERTSGPVNVVSPEPLTNREFARALGRVLHRPAFLPIPAAALRLMFGQMADELLLSSTRVVPARLLESGFDFRYRDLSSALWLVLRK
ncbi:MAG: TIGR01777 family oxidoreductase [Candidatus Zixiibacteriota bacterium]